MYIISVQPFERWEWPKNKSVVRLTQSGQYQAFVAVDNSNHSILWRAYVGKLFPFPYVLFLRLLVPIMIIKMLFVHRFCCFHVAYIEYTVFVIVVTA